MKSVRFELLNAIALLLLSAGLAAAQGTGSIFGTVTDPQGLAIPKTQVTATSQERGTARSVETDSQGGYVLLRVFDNVPYSVH